MKGQGIPPSSESPFLLSDHQVRVPILNKLDSSLSGISSKPTGIQEAGDNQFVMYNHCLSDPSQITYDAFPEAVCRMLHDLIAKETK